MNGRFWIGLAVVLAALAPTTACSNDPDPAGTGGSAGATPGGSAGSAGDSGAGAAGSNAGAAGSGAGAAGAGGETVESLGAIQAQIFDVSCSFSSCHSPGGKKGNLVLGKSGEVPSSSLHTQLVGVAAESDPALVLVKAGDPTGSFLIDKLRAGSGGFKVTQCDEQKNICGDPMPQGAPALPDATIARVERWIAQGALDN